MIFGTDGIRSKMGEYPLDRESIVKLSAVLAESLSAQSLVVMGSDTRVSCALLRSWITSHFGGFQVLDLGVVPTPVVAYETQARNAQMGIMITASHNPAHDNGLKFFEDTGLKLAHHKAVAYSAAVEARSHAEPEFPAQWLRTEPEFYKGFIQKNFSSSDFGGLRLAFDLAHGAGYSLVKALTRSLLIDASFLGSNPDGNNINDQVGSLFPQGLERLVEDEQLDLGFALDGDGDRLTVVAPQVVHGDVVLYALYRNLIAEGFKPKAIVGTIMCGMGLEKALASEGVRFIRAAVGDQNVLAEMVTGNHLLGGETSGHLIQADLFPAGDGFLAALRLARALKKNPELLKMSSEKVIRYPTYEKAYKVRHKPRLQELKLLWASHNALMAELSGHGRLILRYSGTEPKLRLYVEAPTLEPYLATIKRLEDAITRELT